MSRVVVVGAGVGGLAAAVWCAQAGHAVTVLEATDVLGGKVGHRELDGFRFDTGPSLVTMPWVFAELLGDALPLVRVEPITRYLFPDGSRLELSGDLPTAMQALERWAPGAGDDWARFLGACAGMWRAARPVLTGEPPWPPRPRMPGEPAPGLADFLRVRPWHTLRTLARAHLGDARLRLVVERFATYAGADPRRAPAALAIAGYVEHAFGAWHVRGGVYELVRALADRLRGLGGQIEVGVPTDGLRRRGRRATGVDTPAGPVAADWVVWNGDAAALERGQVRARGERGPARRARAHGSPRSLSGYVLMLGIRGHSPGVTHHTIAFPRDYDAEFDDVFARRRPVRDPTLYVSVSAVTDPGQAPPGDENWFVLANAPPGLPERAWDGYEEHLLERLGAAGLDPLGRIAVRSRRTPADLERETGAVGGAIYGNAPHGRLGALRRPSPRVPGLDNVVRAGGTTHPGGGLPLVALSGALAARIVGPA